MTVLLEFKENLRSFYGKHGAYLTPIAKFLFALLVFWQIRARIGYMERLNSIALLLILALVCSILPTAVMLLVAAVMVTLHCFALSLPAGAIAFVLFVIMYLLYFRFAPQYAYNALLTPLSYLLGVPYVMPVANGLLQSPAAVVPTVCGIVTYYFLDGITVNESSLAGAVEEEQLIAKFQEIIKQFTGNREMYLSVAVAVMVMLTVYLIRRLPVNYAWTFAIVIGVLVQFLVFLIGYMQFGMKNRSGMLAIGCAVSAALLVVLQFFFFNLDYTRTERVQFEDDEYYYYVKAVPKRYVSTGRKTVKKISENKRKREQKESVTRAELMKDMDIRLEDDEEEAEEDS